MVPAPDLDLSSNELSSLGRSCYACTYGELGTPEFTELSPLAMLAKR